MDKKDIDDVKQEEKLLNIFFQDKINRYIRQDMEKNRPINRKQYINLKWFFDNIKGRCVECGDYFSYEVSNGKIRNCNLTGDRIDNTRSHELDNIQPMCIPCNCAKSDH